MIYVPDLENYSCFSIINDRTIRGYKTTPAIDTNVDYTDFYINSHYLEKDGSELITSVPVCINSEKLTTEVYYRNDFSHILVIFLILAFICFYLPTVLFLRLFKKGNNIC